MDIMPITYLFCFEQRIRFLKIIVLLLNLGSLIFGMLVSYYAFYKVPSTGSPRLASTWSATVQSYHGAE